MKIRSEVCGMKTEVTMKSNQKSASCLKKAMVILQNTLNTVNHELSGMAGQKKANDKENWNYLLQLPSL